MSAYNQYTVIQWAAREGKLISDQGLQRWQDEIEPFNAVNRQRCQKQPTISQSSAKPVIALEGSYIPEPPEPPEALEQLAFLWSAPEALEQLTFLRSPLEG